MSNKATSTNMKMCPYKRSGFPWGGKLVVFYYLKASEIWFWKYEGWSLVGVAW